MRHRAATTHLACLIHMQCVPCLTFELPHSHAVCDMPHATLFIHVKCVTPRIDIPHVTVFIRMKSVT